MLTFTQGEAAANHHGKLDNSSRLPVPVFPKQLIIGPEGNGEGVGAIRENLRLLAPPDAAGLRSPRHWLTPPPLPDNARPV